MMRSQSRRATPPRSVALAGRRFANNNNFSAQLCSERSARTKISAPTKMMLQAEAFLASWCPLALSCVPHRPAAQARRKFLRAAARPSRLDGGLLQGLDHRQLPRLPHTIPTTAAASPMNPYLSTTVHPQSPRPSFFPGPWLSSSFSWRPTASLEKGSAGQGIQWHDLGSSLRRADPPRGTSTSSASVNELHGVCLPPCYCL